MLLTVQCSYYCTYSYYLWNISQPGKTGTPHVDLTNDPEAQVVNCDEFSYEELARERVITNVFNHYAIPLEITDVIRGTFKTKLWRMGVFQHQEDSKDHINYPIGKKVQRPTGPLP